MKRLFFAMAALVALACAESTAPVDTELLHINVLPDALELVNKSQSPVYYLAIDKNSLAFVDMAPCTDPAACEGIAVGGRKVVLYTAISQYQTGVSEVIVYHWHLVAAAGGGFAMDSLRATEVHLHVH